MIIYKTPDIQSTTKYC